MALNQELVKKIREDFPPESVQVKKSFKDEDTGEQTYLTGYKPQYVIERMNDVWGHEGWDFEVLKHGVEGKEAWVLGRLTIYQSKWDENAIDGPLIRKVLTIKEQFGTSSYNKGTSYGDALKGAATNAFEKACSFLDVGHIAYKGLLSVPESHPKAGEVNKNKKNNSLAQVKKELLEECKKYKINKDAFPVLVKNVLKEDKAVGDMTEEDMRKLIEHLQKHGAPF